MLFGERSFQHPPLGHFIAGLINYKGFVTHFSTHGCLPRVFATVAPQTSPRAEQGNTHSTHCWPGSALSPVGAEPPSGVFGDAQGEIQLCSGRR